jgi:hypothetical protein
VVSFTPRERSPDTHWIEVEWTPEPVWTVWRREIFLPYRDSNSDPSVVQSVASRYTDYDTLAAYMSCQGMSEMGHSGPDEGFSELPLLTLVPPLGPYSFDISSVVKLPT